MPRNEFDFPFAPSTLETIDEAVHEYFNEKVNIHTTTNKGWEKVPMIWTSAERAYQVKSKKELRDDSGTLILPLISIERTSVVKSLSKRGNFFGNVPRDDRGGSITITRRVNQDKTSDFASNDAYRLLGQRNLPRKNNKIVYETISIPMPVYVDVTYTLTLKSEYQQQMNEMITPFVTRTGAIDYFAMRNNGHLYEGFIRGNLALGNNLSSLMQDERKYETRITVNVLGYLVGEGDNQVTPKRVIRENFVEVKLPRERVIFGDIRDHMDEDEEVLERLKNLSDS